MTRSSHRIAALVSGTGWHVADLARAAEELGIQFLPVPFERLTASCGDHPGLRAADGPDLLDQDGILVRMMPPGSLEQVVFRMDAVHRASAAGIPVLNPPRAIETAVDKYLSLSRLELAGVSVPHTWVGESAECAREVFERLGRDIVIKPIFGSEGCGMTRVSDPDLAGRAFRALERLNQVIYAQAYLSHKGYDVRVLVLGDRVLGAIKRVATDGEWRTNVARGGKAAAWIPPDEVVELALAAARATGAIFAGVDLLPTRDHAWVVLEVNAVPGWRALAAVTGLDVAREVLAHLRAMG